MASLSHRRLPNVSRYIANLNVVQPDHDNSLTQDDGYNMEDDLNLFTNTEFYDNSPFDNPSVDQSILSYSTAQEQKSGRANAGSKKEYSHALEDLDAYKFTNMTDLMTSDAVSPVTTTSAHPAYPHSGLPEPFPAPNLNFDPSIYNIPTTHASPSTLPPTPNTNNQEEDAKAAAEEDKRRRNTAASARFRVKKKQREQALEKREKELTDKLTAMEKRVGQLEQENGFLRSLVVEKNGKDGVAEKDSGYRRSSDAADESERSTKETRKGVGTKSAGKA